MESGCLRHDAGMHPPRQLDGHRTVAPDKYIHPIVSNICCEICIYAAEPIPTTPEADRESRAHSALALGLSKGRFPVFD